MTIEDADMKLRQGTRYKPVGSQGRGTLDYILVPRSLYLIVFSNPPRDGFS